MNVCIHAHIRTHIYTYTHVHIYIYAYIYIYIYISSYKPLGGLPEAGRVSDLLVQLGRTGPEGVPSPAIGF